MDDDTDAKTILTAPAPHQKTAKDHKGVLISRGWTPSSEIWEPTTSHTLNEAVDLAQNRPLWRLMSMYGNKHS